MTTLIFRTKKDLKSRFGNSMITEFAKEGSISDALSYFDGSHDFGSFFHNDEKGYYYVTDDNGRELITDDEMENNEEVNCSVDIYSFWTTKIDNLNSEELLSVLKDGSYLAQEVLEANEYSYDDYQVAKYFDDVDEFIGEHPYENYIKDYYEVSEKEFDNGCEEFELNGKFYQKS